MRGGGWWPERGRPGPRRCMRGSRGVNVPLQSGLGDAADQQAVASYLPFRPVEAVSQDQGLVARRALRAPEHEARHNDQDG